MSTSPVRDSLIKDIVLLKKRPFYLYRYCAPFLIIYGIGFGLHNIYFGMEKYEVGIMIGASILFVQILAILFCMWSVDVRCWMMYSKVKSPEVARYAKVTPTSHNGSVEVVPVHKAMMRSALSKIWIEFQKVTYVYDHDERKCFEPIRFPVCETFQFYKTSKGFQTDDDYESSKELYGDNMMEMVIPDFKELFIERASAPFFVFQVFCVALWCLDEYWYYSLFTLFMLVAFEASLVYQQLRNMAEIRKMGVQPYQINVYRCRKWRLINSNQLVSGDIISLIRFSEREKRSLPCDVLLLRGRLIVDEAMLTGESIPQMKDPIEFSPDNTVLDLSIHSRVHVISGGTRIVQHDPPTRKSSNSLSEGASRPPDNGCVGYVLRTGFNTSQGKLLRTILFGVKRVTANNLETFAFIIFLLIFAIAASSYVWVVGSADPNRSRYKLVLNCVLILTSVVPPELPIELSLAVNSSLLALTKLFVFCTEPFRIPFAGKLDICCFDKTGTLTSDSLVVEGVAGVKSCEIGNGEKSFPNGSDLCAVTSTPAVTQMVLATCHALVKMDEELIGDPMEQAILKAVEWNLTKADVVIPKKRIPGVHASKIVRRFHFASQLKRMSVILRYDEPGRVESVYFATVKGAAETLKEMLSSVPADYDRQHQELSRRGARVLALGYRPLGKGLTSQQVRDITRDDIEKDLTFAGFVILSSPLKSDTKAIIREIRHAAHYITMITGDNPLTACYVGKVLKFCAEEVCLILSNVDHDKWVWRSVDGCVEIDLELENWKKLLKARYDLCITGDGLAYLQAADIKYLINILPSVRIFARVSPKQKEQIITTLKQCGFYVLMCGDGTNDVGALKHAHVGVALLSSAAAGKPKKDRNSQHKNKDYSVETKRDSVKGSQARPRGIARSTTNREQLHLPKSRLFQHHEDLSQQRQKLQKMIEEIDSDPQVVKMGDASIAAPFSYKLSSVMAVCHIIKQGRCTLVTTLQMFKILALNALILAYSQSVLYLDGVKFSDGQATLQGLLLAGCFLFISRSKPRKVLSKERPLPNIFNAYTILTITMQFAVHFAALVFLVHEAKNRDSREDVDIEADFEPNLLNSTVYVLSLATQIMTFALNYRGHPFMESLFENKPLLYSLTASSIFLVALISGVMTEVNEQFQIVVFEHQFRLIILQVIGVILMTTFIIDRILRFLLGAGRLCPLS